MRPVFSRKVRDLREAKGLQQEELAHRLGVSTQSISAYENDKAVPRFKILVKLAIEAGKPVAWFFLDEESDDYELVRKSQPGHLHRAEIASVLDKIDALQYDLVKLRDSLSK